MKLPGPILVIKDLLICLLLAGIFAVALLTVPLPKPLGTQVVGSFQFVAFPTGFALYQNVAQSHFYSISPLDDFVIDSQGNRSTLANLNQLPSFDNAQSAPQINKPTDVQTAIENYFSPTPLQYQSLHGAYPATYSAQVRGNTITIQRQLANPNHNFIVQSGLTFKFANEDYVFDQHGQMYSYRTPAEVDLFNQFYRANLLQPIMNNTQLALISGDHQALPDMITIANPKLPDLLVITAQPKQHLWINRLSNAIEVVQPVTEPQATLISNTINIQVIHRPLSEQGQ